jgi:hypothetical protein
MDGDTLTGLAERAGQTVAAAAVTDLWESVRDHLAQLLGRGDAGRTQVAEQWLMQTRDRLTAAAGPDAEQARTAVAGRWAGRFADLLDEDPDAEAELLCPRLTLVR